MVVLGLMGIAPVAMSQNVFTGTWRPDPQVFSPTRKTDVIELANSIYECRSCSPPYKIKVDGHEQTIEGNANYDALSLTVVDDRNTIEESDKNDGKIVKMSLWSVGPDGKTFASMTCTGMYKSKMVTRWSRAITNASRCPNRVRSFCSY